MIKKVYDITGFDCASCAQKSEDHLNKQPSILAARIDFARNKLYLSFKDKEIDIPEILAIIKEVEDDPIEITPSSLVVKENPIFTKRMLFTIIKIAISLVLLLIGQFVFISRSESFSWWGFGFYLAAYFLMGYEIVFNTVKKIAHLQNPLDEELLMLVAATGAFVLGSLEDQDYVDGLIVLILFAIGEIVESIATNRSRNAIMNAVDLRTKLANVERNSEIFSVEPEKVELNEIIVVKSGESIPLDGIIVEGSGYVDTSSLTGEYKPIRLGENEEAFSGTILRDGYLKIKVTKPYSESTVNKVLTLISQSGERKSKADLFITKFAKIYTPVVMGLAILFGLIGSLISKDPETYIYRALEFLVASCPCAIVISVPLAYFSAIGLASKNGIIIKGSNYIDELARLRKLVTDKTGTITHGTFSIQDIRLEEGVSENELLTSLRAAESLSNHPIAKAICHGYNMKEIASKQKNYEEITGMGVETTYQGDLIVAGSYKLMEKYQISCERIIAAGSIVYVAKNHKLLGAVILSDEIKETAQPMVDLLHKEDISIVLLTGDKEDVTKETCLRLGIDHWHSSLLPEEKLEYLDHEMKTSKGATAYIGDGINDAASIKYSDVGIAMGGIGSDLAVENADVVIMNDDPAKVYDAVHISKIGRGTAIFNVIFSIAVKIIVLVLCSFGFLPMWVAVLADTGLTVLLVINSLLILYRKVNRKLPKAK